MVLLGADASVGLVTIEALAEHRETSRVLYQMSTVMRPKSEWESAGATHDRK
jgi:hypothetical protein